MNPRQGDRPPGHIPDIREDLRFIAEMVDAGSRVLDVGCGDGQLLEYLSKTRNIDGRGIEIRQAGVNACVARGLSVIQGDADTDLADYPNEAFDYVIMSFALQATRHPRKVLEELMRVGRRAIVSFPNFGYWRIRLSLLLDGRMPLTKALDDPWYETPNIHLCTISDFDALCADLGLTIEKRVAVGPDGDTDGMTLRGGFANWFGEQAVYRLSRASRR